MTIFWPLKTSSIIAQIYINYFHKHVDMQIVCLSLAVAIDQRINRVEVIFRDAITKHVSLDSASDSSGGYFSAFLLAPRRP